MINVNIAPETNIHAITRWLQNLGYKNFRLYIYIYIYIYINIYVCVCVCVYKCMKSSMCVLLAMVTSGIRPPCGLFAGSLRPKTVAIAGSPCGCLKELASTVEVVRSKNQWSWVVERFANMFANQSTVRDLPTDIC